MKRAHVRVLAKTAASSMIPLLALGAAAAVVQAKTTISFAGWYNTNDELNAMKHVAEAFEKENPSIKVKMVGIQWGGDTAYMEKLMTMTAGNSAPDVILVPFLLYPRFAEANVIQDLSSFIARDKSIKFDNWNATAISASKWKGRFYGLPSTLDAYWVTFNDRLFNEAGLADPEKLMVQGGWTWDAMIAAGQKLTKISSSNKLDKVGILQMGDIESVLPWIWAKGGDLFNDSGTECLLNQKSALDGVNYFYDAIFSKKAGAIAWGPPFYPDLSQFSKASKFAMSPWWQSVVGYHRSQKVKWNVNFVPMPPGPNNPNTLITTVHEVTVSRQSKHKDAAWELVKFTAGPGGSNIFQREVQWFQSSKLVQNHYQQMMQDVGASGVRFLPDAVKRMRAVPRTPAFATVFPAINQQMDRIYQRKTDVENGLKDAYKDATKELKRKTK